MRQEMGHEIIHLFRNSYRSFNRLVGRRIANSGVYQSQHQLLMKLGHNPNCSQIELADKMNISPAAVAVSLKKLEKGGYIVRKTSQEDSRFKQVEITGKGREVIEKSIEWFDCMEQEIFEVFSDEELEQCKQYLERIHKRLNQLSQDDGQVYNR